jgi:sulfite exporter TauE/SafE
MSPFLAGLALGLASSAHCVAMCGPLLLVIGRGLTRSRRTRLVQTLLHHAARTLAYVLLAALAGRAGESLAVRGFGRGLAIVAGAGLLTAAAGSLPFRAGDRLGAALSSRVVRMGTPVLRWAQARPFAGPLVTGVLNGVLPCGMVYGALTAAGATASTTTAMMLMAGFGLGTAGVLTAVATGAVSVPQSFRSRLRPIAPIVMALAALILIIRGVAPSHQHAQAPAAGHRSHQTMS